MKSKFTLLLAVAWLLGLGSHIAMSADAIEPYIDNRTIFVARLDFDRIDSVATKKWLTEIVRTAQIPSERDSRSIARRELLQAEVWVDQFRNAGGKTLYAVTSFADVGSSSFYMVPLDKDSDAKAITAAMISLPGLQTRAVIRGQAMFVGDDATLAGLAKFKPVARPELAMAFAAAGDAPIRAALIPSADVRRVLDALLPAEAGGVRIEGLARSLQWATVAIKSPPVPFLHVQFEASSADAAKSVADVWRQVVSIARQNHVQDQVLLPDLLAAISAPRIEGSKVMLGLEADELQKTADQLAAPFVAAREQAAFTKSLENVKQMLLCCLMYGNSHKGRPFPDSLEILIKEEYIRPAILDNPRELGQHPGYVYIKPLSSIPELEIAGDERRIIIYEAHNPGVEKIVVGFVDGHAEIVNEQVFKKLLEEAIAKSAK